MNVNDRIDFTIDRFQVARAMIKYGGGFVKPLGQALLRADPNNAARIKQAFPEYWAKYTDLANFKCGVLNAQMGTD